MSDFIDRRTRFWAGAAVVVGVALYFGLELQDEPMTPLEMVLELVKIVPGVLVGVGVVLLFRMSYQQREEQLALLRDLEVARLQGQRWRNESRALLRPRRSHRRAVLTLEPYGGGTRCRVAAAERVQP